jgi:hypothetical protein
MLKLNPCNFHINKINICWVITFYWTSQVAQLFAIARPSAGTVEELEDVPADMEDNMSEEKLKAFLRQVVG